MFVVVDVILGSNLFFLLNHLSSFKIRLFVDGGVDLSGNHGLLATGREDSALEVREAPMNMSPWDKKT